MTDLMLPNFGYPRFTLRNESPTITTRSLSGLSYSRRVAAQLFSLSITYPPLAPDAYGVLQAVLDTAAGRSGDLIVPLPSMTGSTEPEVGSLIQFDSHSKLYRVTGGLQQISGGGITAPQIYPELRDGDLDQPYHHALTGRFRLISDLQETQHEPALVSITIELIESPDR